MNMSTCTYYIRHTTGHCVGVWRTYKLDAGCDESRMVGQVSWRNPTRPTQRSACANVYASQGSLSSSIHIKICHEPGHTRSADTHCQHT